MPGPAFLESWAWPPALSVRSLALFCAPPWGPRAPPARHSWLPAPLGLRCEEHSRKLTSRGGGLGRPSCIQEQHVAELGLKAVEPVQHTSGVIDQSGSQTVLDGHGKQSPPS